MRRLSQAAIVAIVVWVATIHLPLPSPAQTQAADQSAATKPHPKQSVVYVNRQYGFRFYLPKSWKGYSILVDKWEGGRVSDEEENAPSEPETGPRISIRHPLWSNSDPRQDIPIMVFTHTQWKLVENYQLSVSAAPIGPCKLGRNAKYVFALPARYNYAFPTGYEEVDEIVRSNSLSPF
jgi:hypothetical protein